ncbi:hypothetical protein FC62_GL000967 [Amylolactobacillus amylotrophicus DSM 20534]|uniref:Uncharacterized protein n=2 Tax=Amylolactobacillus TaxID=2767876 RepID=A0A0R1YM25_9LACO|nr:hypothetical protein FC62_GL000967 [Amylolactobacillus amylotrophicus DSM 20534]KRM43178.1 hypothetical protein FD40_GL000186 [Amylolactobacillus amylophilus DSM 20533 = JCM 1125]GED80420.1 hypothetical protein LAM01_08930 [Amylolactobacillus amylophilus]
MPIGIIINGLAIFLDGVIGTFGGEKMSAEFKSGLNLVFGVCSMTMGIYSIAPMKNMSAVIFAVIIGTAIGLMIHLGERINQGAKWMQKMITKIIPNRARE